MREPETGSGRTVMAELRDGGGSEKALGVERPNRDFGLAPPDELGNEAAGAGGADQADMAVAESVDNIAADARIANAGSPVWHARTVTEPDMDLVLRRIFGKLGKHAGQIIPQDFGPPPVRRGLESG